MQYLFYLRKTLIPSFFFPVLVLCLLMTGVTSAQVRVENKTIDENAQSGDTKYTIKQIASGLDHPWAVAWLPDGSMLVTERPGKLYLFQGEEVWEVSNLPKIDAEEDGLSAPEGGNQGGLMDVVVHPDYADNGWIYFTHTSPGDDDSVTGDAEYGTGTALTRAKLSEDRRELVDVEILYVQVPRTQPGRHYGSRILFPGDGSVIFSIGDRGLRWNSQDLTDPAGSMIRLDENGGAAKDNPFVGREPGNLRPEIYSFGHRNNQGIAQDPDTGEIWTTEHGPNGGDLLHKVEAAQNYGWPQVTFGKEYSTEQKSGIGKKAPGVTPPIHVWQDNMAPSGLAFYKNGTIAGWEGNLFAGSLLKEQVFRLVIKDDKVVQEEVLFQEKIGRIRDVRQGPDGHLYLVTDEKDGEGGVYRVEPR